MIEQPHIKAILTTLPALILNVYSLIIHNLNVLLLLSVSAVSLVFWIIAIKAKRNENKKHLAEIEMFQAQKELYQRQCGRIDCNLKENN